MLMKMHHLAHWLWQRGVPVLTQLLKITARIAFGVVLPPQTRIAKGALIAYQGLGTVIHRDSVIDEGAVIASGVTLGGRSGRPGAPHIGPHAMIGTGAKVLGAVRVGAHASVGANAVVLSDVPDYGVVVGIPARLVRINRPDDVPDYQSFSRP